MFEHIRSAPRVLDNFVKSIKKCAKIELIHDVFSYTLRTWDANVDDLLSSYGRALPEDEEFLMTAAEQLMERGMQKGIQKGMQKGILQGQSEATLNIARNLIKEGLSHETIAKTTGLPLSQIKKLNR